MNELSSRVKNRLISFIGYLGLSNSKFEKECGLSNGYIRNFKGNLGGQKLEDILIRFPQLNKDWLLYGEGEMLNYEIDKTDDPPPQMITLSKTENLPVKSYTSGVPYYNVDFLGGFDIVINDQTIVPEYCIDFKQYNKATCWCDITGHSMEPEINSGDIIALKEIEDFSFLPYGEIYAIITSNGVRTVKRIGPASSPDMYALIPTNKSPEYGIQEIPKEMIVRVFSVLGCMKKL